MSRLYEIELWLFKRYVYFMLALERFRDWFFDYSDNPEVQSHVRSILKIAGGYFFFKAVHDQAMADALAGSIVTLIGVAWSSLVHRRPPETHNSV